MRTNDDDWTITSGVGRTALLVALGRALESRRSDALIDDPFAEKFVAAAGEPDLLPDAIGESARDNPAMARMLDFLVDMMAARTLRIDEAVVDANTERCRQVVILASGLDARAARLPWAPGTAVFEVDQPAVVAFKDTVLAAEGAASTSTRVGCDLRDDWLTALREEGLSETEPTIWLAEGLLPYLRGADQQRLLSTISSSAPVGSVLVFDTAPAGTELSGFDTDATVDFGVDVADLLFESSEFDAQTCLTDQGWQVTGDSIADILAAHGRGDDRDDAPTAMARAVCLSTAYRAR
ncbi:SAM-dependent methyltransferase [Williamsia sterculiae]|nr:SAM-dependent methyltransferase [Williamsia sterculiae]